MPADVGAGCLAELVEKDVVALQLWTQALELGHQVRAQADAVAIPFRSYDAPGDSQPPGGCAVPFLADALASGRGNNTPLALHHRQHVARMWCELKVSFVHQLTHEV
jgi:hypothetical protein